MDKCYFINLTYIYCTEAESEIADKAEQKDAPAASSVQTAGLDYEEFGPRLPPSG